MGIALDENMSNEDWEQLGRDIANNPHVVRLDFKNDALSDQKMLWLFRGLRKSTTITRIGLQNNQLSIAGIRSLLPFLQNASNIKDFSLGLSNNNIQSEGFNMLLHFFCKVHKNLNLQNDRQRRPVFS